LACCPAGRSREIYPLTIPEPPVCSHRAAGRILVMMTNLSASVTRRPIPGSPFNKPAPAPAPVKEFTADDLVTHDRHGLGRVISTGPDNVLVDFGTVQYRINAPYAKLTKL
ncbi:MAG: hypothetical protein M0030_14960, partial [Actinomycetota bacterium]|nr:hypothetical protein [Actinomycetota bacterium]